MLWEISVGAEPVETVIVWNPASLVVVNVIAVEMAPLASARTSVQSAMLPLIPQATSICSVMSPVATRWIET